MRLPVVDMHCHILPAIDDGARTWEDSLAMARAAVSAGVTHLVATPHFMEGTFHTPRQRVLALVSELRERLVEAAIPLEVFPGAEAYLGPDLPARVRAGEVTTVNDGGRYLLVELPYFEVPPWAEDVLFHLQLQGITPIIAHPERNRALQKDPSILYRWMARGMLTQLDAASLAGAYGQTVRDTARALLSRGLIHGAGSDGHGPSQAGFFAALAAVAPDLPAEVAPAVIRGETAALPEPRVPKAPGQGGNMGGFMRRLRLAAPGGGR